MKKISVITPVYYNEHSLPLLSEELLKLDQALREKDIQLEMIFVDDGSRDNSLIELHKFKLQFERTTIVKLSRNFGSMQALRTGLRFVKGDAFTFLSADLQDPPALIIQMADRWLQGEKYIVCAREQRRDPLASRFFSALYYKLLRLFVVKDYPDGGYDLALIDKDLLPYMQNSGKHTNLLLYAHALGFKSEIIRYERKARSHGKSMWTFSKKVNFFVDSILGFSIMPIRYVSAFGIIASMCSFAYGVFIILTAIFVSAPVPGWASTMTLLATFFGVVIFMLGLISEYIWRIFNEVNRSPDAVIDEVF
jgi:dolichol-phosphate mannosyltransferase